MHLRILSVVVDMRFLLTSSKTATMQDANLSHVCIHIRGEVKWGRWLAKASMKILPSGVVEGSKKVKSL